MKKNKRSTKKNATLKINIGCCFVEGIKLLIFFSLSSYYNLVHSAYITINHCSVPNQQLKFDVDKKYTQ